MSKKIDDGPAVTRSTFIDTNSGQATPEPVASEELKATIAETRAAQAAELREEIEGLRQQVAELIEANGTLRAEAEAEPYCRDIQVDAAVSEDDNATVVHVDTGSTTGLLRIYLNDGLIWDGDPETEENRVGRTVDTDGNDLEADVTEPSAEEAAERDFCDLVRQHLHTHGMGPQAILRAVEGYGHVERAAYIASLDSIADSMQLNTDNLRDLAQRSRVAEHLVNGG